jgi:ORF6N domain-containing protein
MPTPRKTAISKLPVPVQLVDRRIYMIRGQKVMLDTDLAELYKVPTKRVNEQVQRNRSRFPKDFMFRLSAAEARNLRSQIATSSWGGRRNLPFAFTEHGVAMLSAVLAGERAVKMSVVIIRAFVRMRELLANHKELALRVQRIEDVQHRQTSVITILADEIEDLKRLPPPGPKRRIGFPRSA